MFFCFYRRLIISLWPNQKVSEFCGHTDTALSLSNRESISRLNLSILQLWNSFPSLVSFHFIISFIRRCNTVSFQSHGSVMFTSINLLSSPGTLISEFGLEESEPFILRSVRGGSNGVFLFWLKFPFWFFHYLYWINSLYGIWENLDFGFVFCRLRDFYSTISISV